MSVYDAAGRLTRRQLSVSQGVRLDLSYDNRDGLTGLTRWSDLAGTSLVGTTSYAYVSPVIAVFLGAIVAAEKVTPAAVAALALILGGVAIIAAQRSPSNKLQAVSRPEDSIAADSRARTG